jgi:hypothetical protein
MDLFDLRLNELPFHLDIVAFWAILLSVGLGTASSIKRISDALSRTEAKERARLAPAPTVAEPAAAPAPTNDNTAAPGRLAA